MGVTVTPVDNGAFAGDPSAEGAYDAFDSVNTNEANFKAAIEELQGRHWSLDNTAHTLTLGERVIAETHAGIINTLPASFARSATDLSDIWIYNADSDSNITLDPDTTDEIFLTGTGQGAGVAVTIAPGELAICSPRVDNASWDVLLLVPKGHSHVEADISDLGSYMSSWTFITDSGSDTVGDGNTINFDAGLGLDFLTTDSVGPVYSVQVNLDLSELTDMTATMVGTDELVVLDAGLERRKAANEINLSIFNNDSNWTANVGTVTSVGGGLNLSGTVTGSGNISLDTTINNMVGVYGTTLQVGYNTSNYWDFNANEIRGYLNGGYEFLFAIGAFHSNGNIYAYSTTTTSDRRLKKDFTRIDNALEKLEHFHGWNYTLKKSGERRAGLIAQEVREALPNAVFEAKTLDDKDENATHLALDYNGATALLVEAVKELHARVLDLEARLAKGNN